MSEHGRFEHASRVMHGGKHCARCTQFFYAGGEVHPIRDSPGYDPSVERVQAEHRAREAQERRYRGIGEEKHHQIVQRPEWANGLSDRHLLTIAKAHGTHASQDLWWEKAGLYEGMGELRYVKGRESLSKVDTRRVARTVARAAPKQTRAEARRVAMASARGGSDLPF